MKRVTENKKKEAQKQLDSAYSHIEKVQELLGLENPEKYIDNSKMNTTGNSIWNSRLFLDEAINNLNDIECGTAIIEGSDK